MTLILFTCEHAGNKVPPRYKALFNRPSVLASHQGWDIGALELSRTLATQLKAPLIYTETTRLLVECNRSLDHPDLYSSFSKGLGNQEKQQILEQYYYPHRNQVIDWIRSALKRSRKVVHISVHTFTPVWEGKERACDVGLLFDPDREGEKQFCEAWKLHFTETAPSYKVKENYPYLGTDDGLVTALRALFGEWYVGIELEVNQKYPLGEESQWKSLQAEIVKSLSQTLK